MRHLSLLCLLSAGVLAGIAPAQAMFIAKAVGDAVVTRDGAMSGCARAGCVQPVQMWPMTPLVSPMPADQRHLLERLLSRRLSDFVSAGERQILSAALARGERLSGDAVAELVAMLREREGMRLAAAQRVQEEERRRQAEAERLRQQEVARAEAAERERQRQVELARAEAAEQERRRQEALARADPAAAERSRQEQELARAEAAEQERRREQEAALARAKAEQEAAAAQAAAVEALARAKAEQERRRQEEELAQAKAQEEVLARAAAVEAARSFVFYDDLPPLRPL